MRLTRRPRKALREPTVEDAHAIANLLVDSWLAAYDGLLPAELLAGLSVAEREEQLTAALGAPKPAGAVRLVAEVDGQIVGFVNAGVAETAGQAKRGADGHGRIGELAVLHVDPGRSREGIGRGLMHGAVKRLRANGCDQVRAWVVDGNEPGFAFLVAQGWTRSTERRREVLDGHMVREVRADVELVN